jgi:putative flippase GtrA
VADQWPVRPTVLRRLADRGRLWRYAITGLASTLTHLLTLTALVEALATRPVTASTAGFVASVAVSYVLQRRWVFESSAGMWETAPRFLVVILVGFSINGSVVFVGTETLAIHYLWPQLVAFVLVPLSNYTLNSLWTFRT